MVFDGLMVSVSGVRGRVGAALTPEDIATYAAAFGAWASRYGNRRIVVGRNSRASESGKPSYVVPMVQTGSDVRCTEQG